MQFALERHVDVPVQEFLQVGDQPPRKPRRGPADDVNEEVNIAFRARVAAADRAENADIARAVVRGYLKDAVTMCSKDVVHRSASQIVSRIVSGRDHPATAARAQSSNLLSISGVTLRGVSFSTSSRIAWVISPSSPEATL